MAMTLIETVTLGSGGASFFQFTNIPQTGKDLVCLFSMRDGGSNISSTAFINFNGSGSGVNYTWRRLLGDGSNVSSTTSDSGTSRNLTTLINGASSTSNTFGNMQLYIANYTSTTNKSWSIDAVTENNSTTAHQSLFAGLFTTSAGITSLGFDFSPNAVQHTTASLYIIS